MSGNANTNLPRTGNAFIDSVSADAVQSQLATGVPASVTLAQAILESGWGKSGLSKKYNNYFGIKGKGPAGTAVMSTGEHFNGKDVVIKDGFRVYKTAAESFSDHGRFFIENKRYSEAMRHADDGERFAKEIHKAGYATDPNYSEKLIGLIRQYKLAQFDKLARGQGQGAVPPPPPPKTATGSSAPSSTAVKELQLLLVKHGYMTQQQMQTGPGIFGAKTRAALSHFVEQQAQAQGPATTSPPPPKVTTTPTPKPPPPTPKPPPPTPKPPPPPTPSDTGKLSYDKISKNFNAKIPGSKYFTWHDALWLPSWNRHAKESEVTPTILANITKQAQALDHVRERFNKAIGVHCWLRPPAYNKEIGGAKNSAHLRGSATDFHIEGYSAEQVRQVLIKEKTLYPGAGELKVTWVHLDLEHTKWFSPW
ncbi:glucosaminidase domain-containing protein [Archangium sp.]|uniref:glucosaminidase domain-containing protein n=1 Tax=Archangium sp. TaxID=1872627 RepID=UPI003899920F